MKNKALSLSALVLATGLTLAACSSDDADTDAAATITESSASDSTTASKESVATEVTLEDGVVKAKAADEPMTAIFGELTNASDKDIVIESFTTSLGEARYEIHEVVNGAMREREEELRIPAGESHELKPGGDHLMIMEYDGEIAAGDEITVTLKLADGSEIELAPVPVRTIGAGDEEYGDLESHGGHAGHDHNGHDHGEHGGHDHGEHN